MGIINYLTDTDLYKLTMMQAVLHTHPGAMVRYKFTCRNISDVPYANYEDNLKFINQLNKEIDHLCSLRFTKKELSYLSKFSYIKPDFIEYLKIFHLDKDHINISYTEKHGMAIEIQGPWVATILFEVPVLAIISELYRKSSNDFELLPEQKGKKILDEKIEYLTSLYEKGELQDFIFVDMGTRRRYSFEWQKFVLESFAQTCQPMFIGTSNVYFAMKLGLKCYGTMAHEWLQAHQQLGVRLEDFQKAAFENWVQEYRGELGIALSDTVGIDAFLKDFDLYFAKLFDGARHDSGDPYKWCKSLIAHYQSMNIDPKTKSAVFSDSLNFKKAVDIYNEFHSKIKVSFGIGTWLTNDMGDEAAQIVIKMVSCNGAPVAKISDSSTKLICEDKMFEDYLKRSFNLD